MDDIIREKYSIKRRRNLNTILLFTKIYKIFFYIINRFFNFDNF